MTTGKMIGQKEARPRLDTYYWGAVLIWVGMVFGADSLGILPQIGGTSSWSWVFLGAGIAGLLFSLYSLNSPQYAIPTTWDWVWSVIFLIIGAVGFVSINVPWWLILIIIGVAILYSAMQRSE